jgi:DNA-binding response OmpR family regulator
MQTLQDQNTHGPYHDEHLHVDLRHHVVILDGETVRLTPMQYQVLAPLVEYAGVVVTRPILLMQFGEYSPEIRERRVDACIHGLRRKLGVYADQYIETVAGVGYRFRPSASRTSSPTKPRQLRSAVV